MKNFNMKAAYERIEEIKNRLGAIADNVDAEAREMTDAEKAERIQLERELNVKQMQILANTKTIEVRRDNIEDANKQMREALKNGQRFELKIQRDAFGGNASNLVSDDYVTPTPNNPAQLTIGDIVEPLYEGLILSKIGLPLLTGLKGNYAWPIVEAFEATIEEETVALGDTKIPLNKLQAYPERIGIAVPVTREALNETDNLIQLICTKYMPVALSSLLNKIMFSASAVTGATRLIGPFVTMKTGHAKTYTGAAPTLAEILALRGICLNEGITAEGEAYVMNETTKALLEATPKWAGANEPIIENGRINGVPVFCNHNVADLAVYYGAFKYAPMGLFGDIHFIVDPYTQSRKNVVDFVLNANYAISVLRDEAFAKLTKQS